MASSVQRGAMAPGRPETTPRPGVWLTEAGLLAMVLIWGVNFSVVKFGTRFLAPLAFNGLRVCAAGVVLVAIALGLREHMPSRRDIYGMAALGLIGHGAYQALFILGLARATVGATALILAASPALVALVGRLLGLERPTGRAWAGIALQLLG